MKSLPNRRHTSVDGREAVGLDVSWITEPDARTLDALARLELVAARHGLRISYENATPALQALLSFSGLASLLVRSGLEAGRQAEEREPAGGVEEEGDPGDPVA